MKCKPRTNKYFMVRGRNCGKKFTKKFPEDAKYLE